MEQPVIDPPPRGLFGALLRARRRRALLSQEQLAARAQLSERTVRDLEAGRVRSPRTDTVRLLADALQLSDAERETWLKTVQGVYLAKTARLAWAAGTAFDGRAAAAGSCRCRWPC